MSGDARGFAFARVLDKYCQLGCSSFPHQVHCARVLDVEGQWWKFKSRNRSIDSETRRGLRLGRHWKQVLDWLVVIHPEQDCTRFRDWLGWLMWPETWVTGDIEPLKKEIANTPLPNSVKSLLNFKKMESNVLLSPLFLWGILYFCDLYTNRIQTGWLSKTFFSCRRHLPNSGFSNARLPLTISKSVERVWWTTGIHIHWAHINWKFSWIKGAYTLTWVPHRENTGVKCRNFHMQFRESMCLVRRLFQYYAFLRYSYRWVNRGMLRMMSVGWWG